MKKLYELFGINPVKGDVGIEIECEGKNLQPVASNGWRTEDDNSLRGEYPHGRCEWVFTKPLTITDSLAALQYMEDRQKREGAVFDFSFRTSVHVHVNVQQLTIDQILSMCYTYFLCERVMMNFCAPHRRGNRFCLRMEDAEGLMNYMVKLAGMTENDWLRNNPHDRIRYSALNLEALWKYGSLEFRGMEGNLDVARIHKWANAFVNMREFAKKFDNVQDIHDLYVKSRPEQFFRMAVGDVHNVFEYAGFENDLRRGFSLTIDIPYAYRAKQKAEQDKPKLKPMWEEVQMPNIADIERMIVENAVDGRPGPLQGLGNIRPAPRGVLAGGFAAPQLRPAMPRPAVRINPDPNPIRF